MRQGFRARRPAIATAVGAGALTLIISNSARAQSESVVLPTLELTGSRVEPELSQAAAGEKIVSGEQINARPFSRPGEALEEAVPGLIVTQHSGEGKANQYFLRGYNLDHGTDLAITLDGMPVNMRTHGHGQGYADLNFLIPELIGSVSVRKGPYFADVGDFGSAGSVDVALRNALPGNFAQMTFGSFGYRRLLGMTTTRLGDGTLLFAGEVAGYSGPWTSPDDMRKINAVLRYSHGTVDNGLSLTAMAYANRWNSTDQAPLRAITSGELGLFDAFDPTDGGAASRFSLSGQWARSEESTTTRVNAYVINSRLDLYNNFTYFLSDPVNGDQFHQHDARTLGGINVSRTMRETFGALHSETTFGFQSRYDDINVSLADTLHRQFLSNVRSDLVKEASTGVYAETVMHWTGWLRTTVGLRGDLYNVDVNSIFDAANSGSKTAGIASPKAGLVLGPFAGVEVFLNAGSGFHSNDARGVTITESPTDPASKLAASPLLVRTTGAEIGVRAKPAEGLTSTLTLWTLDQDSELVFSGDAGDTDASRASRRTGLEWTNSYRPRSWMELETAVTFTRARFIGFDHEQADLFASLAGFPQAQIGNAPGDYVPGAPEVIASATLTLGEKLGWFGALGLRYFGPRPLTEDNAFRSPSTALLNARIGYRFENGWRVQLDAFNVTDSRSDQITYAYGSLLKTDTLYNLCFPTSGPSTVPAAVCQNGVMDRLLHPVEPLAFRVTLAATF
jgi:outer membrane receptor protein involved in Fe transport